MNKNKLLILSLSILGLSAITSCAGNPSTSTTTKYFGCFAHKGIFLEEYAVKQIDLPQAKTLIDYNTAIEPTKKTLKATSIEAPKDDAVTTYLNTYSNVIITVKYYIDGSEAEQVRLDMYQGTDFRYLLEENNYSPFGQMSVRYIYVTDDLLDYMDEENELFKQNNQNLVNPFNDPYTYHEDKNGQLIVQTHSFAELPASVNGGIGATFRQDCELIFDPEGKITFWQSSLGLYTSTPTGTIREGYIFSASFDWIYK